MTIMPEEPSFAAKLVVSAREESAEWEAKYKELLEVCKKVVHRDRLDQCGKPIHAELLAAIAKS